MHGAKAGGREGYICRESKRGRDNKMGEWEKSSQFGEGSSIRPFNRGRGGLMLKLDELLRPSMTFEVIFI